MPIALLPILSQCALHMVAPAYTPRRAVQPVMLAAPEMATTLVSNAALSAQPIDALLLSQIGVGAGMIVGGSAWCCFYMFDTRHAFDREGEVGPDGGMREIGSGTVSAVGDAA